LLEEKVFLEEYLIKIKTGNITKEMQVKLFDKSKQGGNDNK
jgi:hypothetical protein